MVPEVDKHDTEVLLRTLRQTLEATKLEILDWTLSRELTKNDAEAQAVRKLAARSAQQARQWVGKMLGELGTAYPYPNSLNPANEVIDATTVTPYEGLTPSAGTSVVKRIKYARLKLREIDGELESVVKNCMAGSRFNQFLFRVQEHSLQAGMWLGELLNECVEPKQAEPEATISSDVRVSEDAASGKQLSAAEAGYPAVDAEDNPVVTDDNQAEYTASKLPKAEFNYGGQVPAYGNEKTAEQVAAESTNKKNKKSAKS